VRVDRERAGRYGRAATRWGALLTRRPRPGLRLFFGHDEVPGPGEPVAGGTAKFQKLAGRFPNHPTDFTVLYLGTTWLPRDLHALLWLARRRSLPVVANQDGVAYPGWAGDRTDELNAPLRRVVRTADHVLYQSAFSKRSSDLFLGEPSGSWEILHNAVDTELFTPGTPPSDGPVLLLGGDQTQEYRLSLGLRTFAAVLRDHPEARLLVTGRLVTDPLPLVAELGLAGHVELVGRYAQSEAPDVFRRAHLLLHTKVNDPCPTLVLEAMACGLPVVHPKSGGTVELVGPDAGIGVAHPDTFDRDVPPEPEALAAAVGGVLREHAGFAAAARRRAVEQFDVRPWLDRHAALFDELSARSPRV
jgi:glycosyltransferase involved in cell wall biosynthesis